MCGIAGYYSRNNSLGQEALQAMANAMPHRGPDADGFFNKDKVGLAHRRLSIIDLSDAANQPMYSQNRRYVMVYNGEVYNFKEIAAELDTSMKTTSDSEVILEAFAQWGPRAVERFVGMFAIVIYDQQERKLYVFRDRMGIKPVFCYQQNGNWAFASELKAFTAAPEIKQHLSLRKASIPDFLYLGYIPQPHTIYEEVQKFPAGAYAVIDDSGMKLEYYWQLKEHVKADTITHEQQAKEELKSLLESSVRYRLISDVPYGTFLSGGIDSSTVTAIAQSVNSGPLNTFSIGFKEAQYNEADHARKVAEYLGTKHHEFIVSHKEAIELFDSILDSYDEPFSDSSAIPTMLVSKMARQYVTMTLSGDGGDELFMGYGMYTWAQRLNTLKYKTLGKAVSPFVGIAGDRFRRIGKLLNTPGAKRLKSHIFSQEQSMFSQGELRQLLSSAVSPSLSLEEELPALSRQLSPAEAQAFFDMQYYLKDDLLVKVDRASMKYSLETRVPILDHRVVEFALNVDESLKMKSGTQKYLLKQVLYDYVPKELFERPKWGFSIPLKQWLNNELSSWLDEYLSESAIQQTGLFKYAYISKLRKQYAAGHGHLYNRLWLCVLLQKWMMTKELSLS